MSRIGKKPVIIPPGVEIKTSASAIFFKGPKGILNLDLHPNVSVKVVENALNVEVSNPALDQDRALWGLYRSLIANMVKGVTDGFQRKLEIAGVGYRAAVSGNKVVLNLGFSHPVELQIPEGLSVVVEKSTIIISGLDKGMVGQFAAVIRSQKPPEHYKGKGIRYDDEVIRRKAGKAAKAVGA